MWKNEVNIELSNRHVCSRTMRSSALGFAPLSGRTGDVTNVTYIWRALVPGLNLRGIDLALIKPKTIEVRSSLNGLDADETRPAPAQDKRVTRGAQQECTQSTLRHRRTCPIAASCSYTHTHAYNVKFIITHVEQEIGRVLEKVNESG